MITQLRKRYLNIILYSIVLNFISCTVSHANDTKASEECTDTVATIPTEVLPVMFPDTMYASAEVIVYRIDTLDSLHEGTLCTTDDPYLQNGHILAFRRDQHRSADFGGRVSGRPSKFVVDWEFTTDYDNRKANIGTWGGGAGWTGQTVVLDSMVVATSLASKAYFINYETGKAVRPSVDLTNPIKGSPMLDPWNERYLFIGQGVKVETPWGYMTVDISTGEIIQRAGEDAKAWRHWGGMRFVSIASRTIYIPSAREWYALQMVLFQRYTSTSFSCSISD